MARGSMAVETTVFGTGAEILNRPPFKGVSMTIDFTDVTEDEETGKKIVKAGTPINKDGVPVSATPWTGAVGILLVDVREERPQGTILTEAYVHTGRAQKNSGLTYDGALVTAMNNAGNRIRFEEPIITAQ
ncbi:MAG: hypothetical protein HFH48_00150 [Lachnospiraceae bacterium]|jgi:hypothetical protein|nr:hypothetical protein [Lachnospiraceae bacterium]